MASPDLKLDVEVFELRIVGDLSRLRPEPGDVYVVHCDQRLRPEQVAQIREYVARCLPGHACLVLDAHLRLSVASADVAKG